MKKKLLPFIILLFLSTGLAYGNQSTYYFKATAITTSPAAGKVYIENETDAEYKDTVTVTASASSSGNSADHTFTFHAQEMQGSGFKFIGWTMASDTTGGFMPESTERTYSKTITSSSKQASSPEAITLYAFFAEATDFYSSAVSGQAIGDGGAISVSTTPGSIDFAETMADTVLHNIDTIHTYYLKAQSNDNELYRFTGWYGNADCTEDALISTKTEYTYEIVCKSQDETNIMTVPVYGKFEAIPYYYSDITVIAIGDGQVGVNLKSGTTFVYSDTARNALKVADKTIHTYYVSAQSSDFSEFGGWYSDEDCTDMLAADVTYQHEIQAESMDETHPTKDTIYAKFIDLGLNPYQFRNASFEEWNSKLNEPAPGWHGPATAVGTMADWAGEYAPSPERVEDAHSGQYAVRLHSTSVIIVKANGNLTTGVMNIGNMTPSSSSNNNHTVVNDKDHHLIIIGQPDSVAYYTKYKKGENGDYMAHAQIDIHDAFNFQEPRIDGQEGHLIAEASVFTPESNEWLRSVGAIEYQDNWDFETAQSTTKYVLASLTTNLTPGGSAKDTLIIDDISFIYNSELAEAKQGNDTIIFIDGIAVMDVEYNADELILRSNGRGAFIDYAYDASTGYLDVVVEGQDIDYNPENSHTYQVRFRKSTPSAFDTINAAYEIEGVYDALGRKFHTFKHGVNIIRLRDGSIRKVVK